MIRSRFRFPMFLAILSPMMLGCDASQPLSPAATVVLDRASTNAVSKPQVAVCPSHFTESTSSDIGPAGGTLRLSGHSLTIPAGAFSRPRQLTLTAPAGPHLQLLVTVQGSEPMRFRAPAAVTISYERCKRQNLAPASAAVISPTIRGGGTMTSLAAETDPAARTLSFEVNLSSEGDELIVARGIYAVAY